MVKVMYNDQLVYKVVICVFWGLFYEKDKESLTPGGGATAGYKISVIASFQTHSLITS